MKPDAKSLILPVLVITVGAGWLLTTLGVAPGIDWIWTLGLAVVGLSAFAAAGLDKVTVVVGPFLVAASGLSLLRQAGRLPLDVELPVLLIVSGVLLLVSRSPAVPAPAWIAPQSK